MTTVNEIEHLVEAYRLWFKTKTKVREIDSDWVEITTPYLDRHNDALQIYAKKEKSGYVLTDDRYTIDDLEASGCNLQTVKRQDLLAITLNGFGVKLHNSALEVHASAETFPSRKHDLVQAMMAVNDLFYLAQPVVESLFLEDVTAWMDETAVRYLPNVKFTGVSGYDHRFHFGVPKSKKRPERIVEAITRPTKETAADIIFRWNDIREVRATDAQAYAILNDREHVVASSVVDALGNYGIRPVRWSERYEVGDELAA